MSAPDIRALVIYDRLGGPLIPFLIEGSVELGDGWVELTIGLSACRFDWLVVAEDREGTYTLTFGTTDQGRRMTELQDTRVPIDRLVRRIALHAGFLLPL